MSEQLLVRLVSHPQSILWLLCVRLHRKVAKFGTPGESGTWSPLVSVLSIFLCVYVTEVSYGGFVVQCNILPTEYGEDVLYVTTTYTVMSLQLGPFTEGNDLHETIRFTMGKNGTFLKSSFLELCNLIAFQNNLSSR